MKIRTLIFVFLVSTTEIFSESYGINLDSVMLNSVFKDEVIIKSYKLGMDSSVINIEVVKVNRQDSSFFISKFIPDDFRYGPLIYFKKFPRHKDFPNIYAYWPDVGERVLVVLDKEGTLIFFGEIIENKYRLFTRLHNPAHGTGFYSKYSFEEADSKHKYPYSSGYLYLEAVFLTKADLLNKWKK